ncbi:unnamed protein product [Amoebophrya sp. A25]|nr:unnamed protein product [Amoebophrya sp. A25]|eukprot:GSA25T00013453001.1
MKLDGVSTESLSEVLGSLRSELDKLKERCRTEKDRIKSTTASNANASTSLLTPRDEISGISSRATQHNLAAGTSHYLKIANDENAEGEGEEEMKNQNASGDHFASSASRASVAGSTRISGEGMRSRLDEAPSRAASFLKHGITMPHNYDRSDAAVNKALQQRQLELQKHDARGTLAAPLSPACSYIFPDHDLAAREGPLLDARSPFPVPLSALIDADIDAVDDQASDIPRPWHPPNYDRTTSIRAKPFSNYVNHAAGASGRGYEDRENGTCFRSVDFEMPPLTDTSAFSTAAQRHQKSSGTQIGDSFLQQNARSSASRRPWDSSMKRPGSTARTPSASETKQLHSFRPLSRTHQQQGPSTNPGTQRAGAGGVAGKAIPNRRSHSTNQAGPRNYAASTMIKKGGPTSSGVGRSQSKSSDSAFANKSSKWSPVQPQSPRNHLADETTYRRTFELDFLGSSYSARGTQGTHYDQLAREAALANADARLSSKDVEPPGAQLSYAKSNEAASNYERLTLAAGIIPTSRSRGGGIKPSSSYQNYSQASSWIPRPSHLDDGLGKGEIDDLDLDQILPITSTCHLDEREGVRVSRKPSASTTTRFSPGDEAAGETENNHNKSRPHVQMEVYQGRPRSSRSSCAPIGVRTQNKFHQRAAGVITTSRGAGTTPTTINKSTQKVVGSPKSKTRRGQSRGLENKPAAEGQRKRSFSFTATSAARAVGRRNTARNRAECASSAQQRLSIPQHATYQFPAQAFQSSEITPPTDDGSLMAAQMLNPSAFLQNEIGSLWGAISDLKSENGALRSEMQRMLKKKPLGAATVKPSLTTGIGGTRGRCTPAASPPGVWK